MFSQFGSPPDIPLLDGLTCYSWFPEMNTGCPVGRVPGDPSTHAVLHQNQTQLVWAELRTNCLVTGPWASFSSSFPTFVCQHLASITQMGQFIPVLAIAPAICLCMRGAMYCHSLCPALSFISQESWLRGSWRQECKEAERKLFVFKLEKI